ncbi:pyridoxamine kinase [uncultured Megasphaera sp.]|uniref:pyridoxamine kinase n=1 Tax=uncultured Megasphaera sp. TaxID=165188 RepID=UPI0037852D73
MFTKRVLAIHDLCSFGRCSLTAVVPVISAMGFQVCPLPTTLSSNNITYQTCYSSDVFSDTRLFMEKWEEIGCSYQAIYSGFLSDFQQMQIVWEAIRRFSDENTLVVIDPVMSFAGRPLPVYSQDMIEKMRTLIRKATVITPTLIEACMLTGTPVVPSFPSLKDVLRLCHQLSSLGPRYVVITRIPASDIKIKNVSFDGTTHTYDECQIYRVRKQVDGLSDLFASVLTGALLRNHSIHMAMRLSLDFLSYALDYTRQAGSDAREGIQIEPCLRQLLKI